MSFFLLQVRWLASGFWEMKAMWSTSSSWNVRQPLSWLVPGNCYMIRFFVVSSPRATRGGLHKWDSHRLDSAHWCHEPQVADGSSHSFDYASAAGDAASRILVANRDAVYARRALFICIQKPKAACSIPEHSWTIDFLISPVSI